MKDEIQWFGEKGKDGVEVVKMAGKAVVVGLGLVAVGVVLGAVGNAFGGGN